MSLRALFGDISELASHDWGSPELNLFVRTLVGKLTSNLPVDLHTPLVINNFTNGNAIEIYNQGGTNTTKGIQVKDTVTSTVTVYGVQQGSSGITAQKLEVADGDEAEWSDTLASFSKSTSTQHPVDSMARINKSGTPYYIIRKIYGVMPQYMTITSVNNDYLECLDIEGTTQNVMKPFELRVTGWDGEIRNTLKYQYLLESNGQDRQVIKQVHPFAATNQSVYPLYLEGDKILVRWSANKHDVGDISNWLDMNDGARRWIPGITPTLGVVPSSVTTTSTSTTTTTTSTS